MGALSSWASLAIVHHFIVQVSAWRAGVVPIGVWYKNYAILGDDLVIGDRAVADEYLKVLAILGVECGLHKSVLSNGNVVIEFAKRTFYKGVDISPIPFSEFQAALTTLGGMREFVSKYRLSLTELAKTFGFRFKVLGGLNRSLWNQNHKLRSIILALNLPTTPEEAKTFFDLGIPAYGMSKPDAIKICTAFMEIEAKSLAKTLGSRWESVLADTNPFWNFKTLEKLESTIHLYETNPDLPPSVLKVHPKTQIQIKDDGIKTVTVEQLLVRAFAALVDVVILPTRQRIVDVLRPVHDALLSGRVMSPEMTFESVFIWFLGLSRDSASVSSSALSLDREIVSPRGVDPLATRLWNRWIGLLFSRAKVDKLLVRADIKIAREEAKEPSPIVDDVRATEVYTDES